VWVLPCDLTVLLFMTFALIGNHLSGPLQTVKISLDNFSFISVRTKWNAGVNPKRAVYNRDWFIPIWTTFPALRPELIFSMMLPLFTMAKAKAVQAKIATIRFGAVWLHFWCRCVQHSSRGGRYIRM